MYNRKLAFWSIITVLTISIWAAWNLQYTSFDYNFENFFPKDDTETDFFLKHREEFRSDNDFLLLGIESPGGVFDFAFLKDLDSITRTAERLPFVEQALSLTALSERIREPYLGQLFTRKAVDLQDESRLQSDSAYIMNHPLWAGTFVSKDGRHAAIFLRTQEYLSKAKSDELAYALGEFQNQFPQYRIHQAGRTIAQLYYVNKMQFEFLLFVSISAILLLIFLAITYRSISGVLLPLIVVALSVLWTLGLMAYLGKSLNLLLTVMPTIIFVVGMSDVVHFKSKYLEELREGKPKPSALWSTLKEIGLATFLTSMTTALGFATLLTSSVLPVNDFGLYAAIGVVLAFVVTMLTLPAALFFLPVSEVLVQKRKDPWKGILHRILKYNFLKGKKVLAVSLLILVISVAGIYHMKVNSFLLEGLRPGDRLRDDFSYFGKNFSGARPFEVSLSVKDVQITDYESLLALEKVDTKLVEIFGAEGLVSPVSLVKTINKIWNGGDSHYFQLPDREDWNQLKPRLERLKFTDKLKDFVSEDQKRGRISGNIADVGSHEFYKGYELFNDWWANQQESSFLDVKITGSAWLIDRNNEYLAQGMLNGLFIAFFSVAVILLLLMKSFTTMVLALLPNILPLLVMAGFMGWFGIDIKISTSIVFSLAFGIAVDDSIHMLSRFRLEQHKGKSYLYALKRTTLGTGKAIVLTTLILCSGFVALTASSFNDTFYIGLLVSIALFAALLADLFLLPVLLLAVYKRRKKAVLPRRDNS